MACEKLPNCPFYNDKMPIDKGLGAVYRKTYCDAGDKTCARYMVATSVGPQSVPLDLFPNMASRAEQIIAEKNKA